MAKKYDIRFIVSVPDALAGAGESAGIPDSELLQKVISKTLENYGYVPESSIAAETDATMMDFIREEIGTNDGQH